MGHAAAPLLIVAQPLVVLATVLLPPVSMARRGVTAIAVALWVLALALLIVWGVSTYRAAVHANETGIEGGLLPGLHWLVLALCAALFSLVVVRRSP